MATTENQLTILGKELTRQEKLKKSRKITTDLTRKIIDWLNDTGYFIVWRNNSIPSTRHEVVKETINAFDKDGNPIEILTEYVKVHFKKNQKTISTLDIIGYRSDNVHTEIEIKTGNDKLDKEQKEHLSNLQKAGCVSFATSDFNSFKEQIKPFLFEKVNAF